MSIAVVAWDLAAPHWPKADRRIAVVGPCAIMGFAMAGSPWSYAINFRDTPADAMRYAVAETSRYENLGYALRVAPRSGASNVDMAWLYRNARKTANSPLLDTLFEMVLTLGLALDEEAS